MANQRAGTYDGDRRWPIKRIYRPVVTFLYNITIRDSNSPTYDVTYPNRISRRETRKFADVAEVETRWVRTSSVIMILTRRASSESWTESQMYGTEEGERIKTAQEKKKIMYIFYFQTNRIISPGGQTLITRLPSFAFKEAKS